MERYLLGRDLGTKKPFYIPSASYSTHWHLIGGTGKGKTTAIHRMLHELMLDPAKRDPCIVIIDRMGNLSWELLLWMASDYCTEDVRDRLVYIEPAREDVVMGFNPLLYETPGHAYYKVSRAADIILRGWASQNLAEMPRLARWLFNSFFACALLGLTIADTVHLITPASPYHRPILDALPGNLQYEWQDLLRSNSGEVTRILDSTRNRLKPFYDSSVLRNMFGATVNRLDVLRFMREGKIVILNLWPQNRLHEQIADAIGGLVINEVLTTARSLPFGVRYPTYLFLDEFQRFIGPDMESAIPEVRQLGIRMILSHQSFSQLERGDYDLRSMIFQAQSRMIFGMHGEDADILAQEMASLNFNPKRLKDEWYSFRQRQKGNEIVELSTWQQSHQDAQNWNEAAGESWVRSQNVTYPHRGLPIRAEGSSRSDQKNRGRGGGSSDSTTSGGHQQLVPILEDYWELASRTYYTFDESMREWARDIRRLRRGSAYVRIVDDPTSYHVDVKRSAPGYLSLSSEQLAEEFPEAINEVKALVERNFQSEFFVSPAVIEQETRLRLERVVRPASVIPANRIKATADDPFIRPAD